MPAAVDGELSSRRRRALDRHLAGCEQCRRELVTTERMLAAVAAMPAEAPVSAPLEAATLRRVRLLAAEVERGARPWWGDLRLPAVAGAGVAVLLLAVGIARQGGSPEPGVVPGPAGERVASAPVAAAPEPEAPVVAQNDTPEPAPAEPPAELAARPDLFVDLPILRNLDKLSNFDTIRTTTLEEPPAADDAGTQGNG